MAMLNLQVRTVIPCLVLQILLTGFLAGNIYAKAPEQQGNTSAIAVEKGIPKLTINGKTINNMFGIEVFSADVDAESPQFLTEMKKAIDRTAALNIPIFSFEILWHDYDHSTTEPRSAEEAAARFNTKNLDAILDYAAAKKLYVMLELLKHGHWALPKWWKSYKNNHSGYQMLAPPLPEVAVYNREQTPVASFENPAHRELLTALITRLVLRYRAHPAVFGYGINIGPTGENGYIPNYIDIALNSSMPKLDFRAVMGDYSPLAGRNFISFLRTRYPSIADLNRKWQTNYSAFEEISPPFPIKTTVRATFTTNGDDRPAMHDWQLFRHEAIVDEWKFMSTTVRQLDPNKVIMGKTNWNPVAAQTGTEFMQISSVQVNALRLIDIDKGDACLHAQDYLPEFEHTSSYSMLDYVHFSRFSKKYGTIRIFNLDNSAKKTGNRMDLSVAIPAKEVLRKEGCYLWFPVTLGCDTLPKPDWSWNEIEALVKRSNAEELKEVTVEEPRIYFYFDADNLMSHYYDSLPGLKANGLAFALSKAFFDSDPKPVGFLSSADVLTAAPDSKKVKLLVLADQRAIASAVVTNLKAYVNSGGTLLLLGSNGIFDIQGRKDSSALLKLVPSLADSQLYGQYQWGLSATIKVPFFIVSKSGTQFGEIDISKSHSQNYKVLTAAIPDEVGLPANGQLIFVTVGGRPTLKDMSGTVSNPRDLSAPLAEKTPVRPDWSASPQGQKGFDKPDPEQSQQARPPQPDGPSPAARQEQATPAPVPQKRNFIKDWDRDGDGVVMRNEFTGDPSIFPLIDRNGDGKITQDEAKQAGE